MKIGNKFPKLWFECYLQQLNAMPEEKVFTKFVLEKEYFYIIKKEYSQSIKVLKF